MPKSIIHLHWYNEWLTCAQMPKRLRWGTGSAGRPLFIQESGLIIVHMHSLQGSMWTHACVSKETGRKAWKAVETAGNTEKLPEKRSCGA
jgi:hypothetical protein